MSTYILHTIFTNWHPRRYLGLFAAGFIVSQAILLKDGLLGMMSAVIFFQVLTNSGCFGSKGCAVPGQPDKANKPPVTIDYDHLK